MSSRTSCQKILVFPFPVSIFLLISCDRFDVEPYLVRRYSVGHRIRKNQNFYFYFRFWTFGHNFITVWARDFIFGMWASNVEPHKLTKQIVCFSFRFLGGLLCGGWVGFQYFAYSVNGTWRFNNCVANVGTWILLSVTVFLSIECRHHARVAFRLWIACSLWCHHVFCCFFVKKPNISNKKQNRWCGCSGLRDAYTCPLL